MTTTQKLFRADRNIEWIERLSITLGKDAGKPFILREWQRAFIRDIYREENNRRTVRRAVLSVARKNGKSELAAALALLHLIGPEAEPYGEIILAANSRDQAAIVFRAVQRLVECQPALQQLIEVVPSTKRAFVKRTDLNARGSTLQAVSADAGTKHGLNPSLVIYDELAQAKNRELFDTLTTSQGARHEPLFLTISTQNNDAQHVLSEMIDDALTGSDPSVIAHLHAADDDCELLDETQWFKANPALGDFRDYDELKTMAHRAARLPSEEQAFRLLYLNQRVSLHSTFIAARDWKGCSGDATWQDGEEIVLSVDMSATTDLTALTGVSCGPIASTKSWFWKPSDYLAEHSRRDRANYELWARDGYLQTSKGRIINPTDIAREIADLADRYTIKSLVFDPWRKDELLARLAELGLDLPLVEFRQGFYSMSPAVDAFERAVLTETLVHDNNPVQNFCVLNAVVESDAAGNRKIAKNKVRQRIDGAVSLAMALRERARFVVDEPEPTNPWDEDEGFSLLDL